MSAYIVYFPERDMYLRGSRLLVHSRESAKKYTAASAAKRAAKNSSWGEEPFTVINTEEETKKGDKSIIFTQS